MSLYTVGYTLKQCRHYSKHKAKHHACQAVFLAFRSKV